MLERTSTGSRVHEHNNNIQDQETLILVADEKMKPPTLSGALLRSMQRQLECASAFDEQETLTIER